MATKAKLKRYNGSTWEQYYPETTTDQVVGLATEISDIYTDIGTKVSKSGGTMSGTLTIDTGSSADALVIKGTAPFISLLDDDSGADDFYIHTNANNFYILTDRDGGNQVGTGFESPYPLQLEADTNIGYLFGNRIFSDNYHPNADSVPWTGITGKPSTFTPSSHTHAISDVTGLQTALDGKATESYVNTQVANLIDSSPTTLNTLNELAAALGDDPNFATTVTNSISGKLGVNDKAADSDKLDGADSSSFLRSNIYDSADAGLQVFRNLGTATGSWQDGSHTFGLENSDAGYLSMNFHRAGYTSHNLLYTGTYFNFDTDLRVNGTSVSLEGHAHDGRYYTESEADSRFVNASGDTMSGTLTYTLLNGPGTQTRDKIRVWSSGAYAIGMKSGYTFGGLNNDYAMSFQMNDDNDRGFWWGDDSHTDAQGAMSLTTGGRLTVAEGIRVGYGQSDTTAPGSTGIQLNGTLDFGSSNGQVKLSRGSYITFYEDTSAYHAIGSRDASGNEADDLRINSYGGIYLNLDSNNNNTSGADFVIYRHGGTGAMSDTVFSIGGETKTTNFYGQIDLNNNDIYGVDQIFHEGDTNTYMQFHASDQWRVVTGGGERLEVNNSAVTVSNKLVGKINEVNNNVGINFWTGTQAQYNAIGTKSSTTLYFITG